LKVLRRQQRERAGKRAGSRKPVNSGGWLSVLSRPSGVRLGGDKHTNSLSRREHGKRTGGRRMRTDGKGEKPAAGVVSSGDE
jgi:hypothetical protein